MIDYGRFPNPCYIMEEDLLRKNLRLIKYVADEADVEIILAFKAFALWKSFPAWLSRSLVVRHTPTHQPIQSRSLVISCDIAVTSPLIHFHNLNASTLK